MIHLVVALPSEARPIIEAFGLEAVVSEERPRIFSGERAHLAVTGVGRSAAREGTLALHRWAGDRSATAGRGVWLNVGLAAHRDLPIGAPAVAHELVEEASGRRWFPQLVVEPPTPTMCVKTVDEAVESPREDVLYEMEATGFYPAALQCAPAELVGCLKIVSDHGIEDSRRGTGGGNGWLDRETISSLVAERLPEILAFAGGLEELAARRLPDQPVEDLSDVLDRWHFTVTQRRQLAAASRRAGALGSSVTALLSRGAAGREPVDSRQVLLVLEDRLDLLAGKSGRVSRGVSTER